MPEKTRESLLLKSVIFQLILLLRNKSFESKYMNKLKVTKIVYDVIKKLDLPITNSWYLRGCYIHAPTTQDSLLLDPREWNKIDDKEIERTQRDNQELFQKIRSEIYNYLEDTDILTIKTDKFLINLYKESAPEDYKAIYLANHELRHLLEESLHELIENLNKNKVIPLFLESRASVLDKLSPSISRLQISISNNQEFNKEQEIFYDFFNLIEEIMIKFDSILRESNQIPKDIEEFIESLGNSYMNNIWKIIALKISQNTINGPRADKIRTELIHEYVRFSSNSSNLISDIQEKARELNLIPTHKEYEIFFTSKHKIDECIRKDISEIL